MIAIPPKKKYGTYNGDPATTFMNGFYKALEKIETEVELKKTTTWE